MAMVLPLVHLVLRASEADDVLGVLGTSRIRDAVLATLLLGVTVTSAASALAIGIAWLLERTDVPGRRVLGAIAAVPLVVPTYVAAVALKDAFGPRALLVRLPGVVGFWGAAAALTLSTYPYVLLLARAAFASADPSLAEAARSLGDSPRAVARRITLPTLRPAVAAGGLLVFLYVLSDFGAVTILRYETITLTIFGEYRTSFDRAPAALLGLVLVGLTIAAIAAEHRLRGRPNAPRITAGVRPAARVALGARRWPAAAAIALVALAGAGLPIGTLLYRTVLATTRGEASSVVLPAAATSVALAAAAASIAVVLAVPVAALAVRFRSRFSAVVEGVSVAGYALPGLVIALALVFFSARYLPGLYQTVGLIVVAYVIRFFPEALGATRTGMAALDPAVEEAARSLGDNRVRMIRNVTIPLLRPSLFGAGLLVFLTSMKELPATLLLRPPGVDTLATRVWTGAAEGRYAQAAPSALLLIAVSALALASLRADGARRRSVGGTS